MRHVFCTFQSIKILNMSNTKKTSTENNIEVEKGKSNSELPLEDQPLENSLSYENAYLTKDVLDKMDEDGDWLNEDNEETETYRESDYITSLADEDPDEEWDDSDEENNSYSEADTE
jgi:hypothetical protein